VGFILETEMAEGESAAVIGPTRLPASRVASPFRCNRCEPGSLVEPSTPPSSSLSIPVSRFMGQLHWKWGRPSRAPHGGRRMYVRQGLITGARRTLFFGASDGVNQHFPWADDLFRVLSLHPAVAITELFQIAASFLHVLAPDRAEPFEIVRVRGRGWWGGFHGSTLMRVSATEPVAPRGAANVCAAGLDHGGPLIAVKVSRTQAL